MRSLALLVLAACASGSPYRDVHGRPLPSTAALDADVPPVVVHCGSERYRIVTAPHPYLVGTHAGTHRPVIRDARALCAQIRAFD